LLAGGKRAIAADLDEERLAAAREIATVLSIEDRMKFIHAPIQDITLKENEADIFVSIETLEHIGKKNIKTALRKIKDCASKVILLTTPNKLFPVIAHDTRLPFLHWLPAKRRSSLAKLFGREKSNDENDFLSPLDFRILTPKFKPVSTCLTFSTFKEYIDHYPFYLPYGDNEKERWKVKPYLIKPAYYKTASGVFGRCSYWVMPTLASIFVRK